LTFPILQQNADDVLTVSDAEILTTIRFMLFRMKTLVEPSGAAAAAAVLHGRLPAGDKRVGVIVSGGNIDPDALVQLLS
jgi:threonine dehydratase